MKSYFHKICNFIKDGDECIHSVSHLLRMMQDLLNSEKVYEPKYLKKLLTEHFGYNIFVIQKKSKSDLILFVERAAKQLPISLNLSTESFT